MTLSEIKYVLLNEAQYTEKQIDEMDGWDILDAWLKYEGIIGYTNDIISAVLSVDANMESLKEYCEDVD